MHLDACPKRFDSVQKSQTHSNHFGPTEGPGISKIVIASDNGILHFYFLIIVYG